MRRITTLGPVVYLLILCSTACSGPVPDDDAAGVPEEVDVAPSEELGSAVGLEGVAAYRGADADRNARLDADEFGGWFDQSGAYDRWDADRDGNLTEDEFMNSAFEIWDDNGDNRLSQEEWQQGTRSWLPDTRVGMWTDWDTDGNGFVSRTEYNSELHEHNLYDTLDQDLSGILGRAEFRDAWFRALDTNRDTGLDETEWRAVSPLR